MRDNITEHVIQKVFQRTPLFQGKQYDREETRYFVIPGKEGPRWVLPDDWHYGRVFLKGWSPYGIKSRLKWGFLMSAYRTGILANIPGVITIPIVQNDQSWKYIGWALPDPPTPVIYVGTPGFTRKAVVGLVDRQNYQVEAIAKIPLVPGALHAIQYESKVLSELARLKPNMAPRSLYSDEKSGIATQEAVLGKPVGRKLTAHHIAFLIGLNISRETISLREVAESLTISAEFSSQVSEEAKSLIECVLSEIDDPTSLPAVWVHGDFAPWNLKMRDSQTLVAVDWEFANPRGLPLFDLVYFSSIQMFLFGDKLLFPRYAWPLIRSYLKGLGLASWQVGKIILACLLQNWYRANAEGNFNGANFLLSQLRNRLRGEE